jgi:hypothetical protein
VNKGSRKAHVRTKRSLREVQQWGGRRHVPSKASSLDAWRHERRWARLCRTKPHRFIVGYIRAFIGTHYFAGAYTGAEND